MSVEISKITIKNFKNLKNVTVRPKKFNILIGPNGSGKTNFFEFFKLLRKIYVERNPYPFLEWDGYENVVWNHQVSLPIEFEIETVEQVNLSEFAGSSFKKVEFKKDLPLKIFRRISASFWADRAENLKILRESVEVEVPELKCLFSIEKSGETWKIKLNNGEWTLNDEEVGIESLHIEISKAIENNLKVGDPWDNSEYMIRIPRIREVIDLILFVSWGGWWLSEEEAKKDFESELNKVISEMNILPKELEKPVSENISEFLFLTIYQPLLVLFKTTVLFSLNLPEIKYKRKIIPRAEPLGERGENVLDILALIQHRNGKLPETMEYAVETYFNSRAYFRDRNFYLYDTDKKVEFSKEHLPDGLIKMITILTAVEQKPGMLLIDEIENSLHPELIEFLVEILKEEYKGYTFLSTHSPIVLNLAEPEEIWIFKSTDKGVEIKNVTEYKSRKELLKELEELGITLGDKVLYGFT